MISDENIDMMLSSDDIIDNGAGDIALVGGDDSLIQSAIHNMKIIYGELENEPTRGNMVYDRRLKLTDSSLRQVEQDCKNAIMYDSRISGVTIEATRTSTNYECGISFGLIKLDGTTIYGGTIISLL